ncbi:ankyrin repeat domain-containing protein [Cellvibrio sp. NN19]|uniref:ankyrin repeat domain-containing protein n=1 Tax=Cellvibrio chitinivorans TaxID=3102792 RepID=UPI002B409FA8|nr:ankyrin repeat domain-containing protein [Cellvibrio sp. NN19]
MTSYGITFMRAMVRATLIAFIVCVNATAEELQLVFPEKAWFKPELIENNSPVCQEVLENAKLAFFENNVSSNYHAKDDEVLIAGAYSSSNPDHVLIDNKPVYIKMALQNGCGGGCEGEQVIVSEAPIDQSKRYVHEFDSSLLEQMPAETAAGNTLFIKAKEGSYYLISIRDSIEVNQLQSDATWKKSCEISLAPTEAQYSAVMNAAQLRDILKELELSLMPIIGSYGNCGSLRSGSRRIGLLKQLVGSASYRPWVIDQNGSAIKNSFTYLDKWSLQGVHQFNSYTNFNSYMESAIPNIKSLYEKLYGLSDERAEQMANSVVKGIVARVISPAFSPRHEEREKILKVLLEKGDISIIKSISTDVRLIDRVESYGVASDSLLAAAVTYPEALQYLLDQGLDPNQQNEFGKTPLMYAVQENQLESVSILLSKKADPNLSTNIPNDNCNYTLSKSGMRALHYAARYASPEVIKLLIEKGADPIVATSEKTGGYPIDWMRKYTATDAEEPNKNIPIGEILALEKLLSLPSAEEMKKLVLNYNAGAEKSYSKKNLDEAYSLTQKALQLQPNNERALSNLGLIAMKMDKNEIALEAMKKLIDNGTDKKMVANAWFNYGMLCDLKGRTYYNGETYCRSSRIHNYLSSYVSAPSEARKNKLLEVVETSSKACRFKGGEIVMLTECGPSSWDRRVCFMYPSGINLDLSNFTGSRRIGGNIKEVGSFVAVFPMHLKERKNSYLVGDQKFDVYLPEERLGLPIKWGDEICKKNYTNDAL